MIWTGIIMLRPRFTPKALLLNFLLTCSALTGGSGYASANPEGGVVVGGAATIQTSGTQTTITQNTNRAAINWSSFNVNADETVRFNQPSSSSIALNRVRGNDPSNILGSVQANGSIFLINPNGIVFGQGAKIDAAGIIASTADMDTDRFMNTSGTFNFSIAGNPSAKIINQGQINARDAGLVGLVAPQIENSGIITARLGRIQMGAADIAAVDLYGDSLISLEVTNDQLKSIAQTGALYADGGLIQITAAAGKDVVNSLIGASGYITAKTIGSQQGKILIHAQGSNAVENNVAADKGKKTGKSKLMVDAILDASGYGTGQTGGSIALLADEVEVASGTIADSSGDQGGGQILVGGDYLGSGETPASISTYVDPDSFFLNNAVSSGNGGKTIVWSDGNTEFYGNIFSRGGSKGGNGGFAETSGHDHLTAQGYVDLTAPQGEKGTYLLDPANIAIYGNVTPRFQATDSSVNLLSSLRFWVDGGDASTVLLNYHNNGLSGALVNGVAGNNTLITTTNLNLTTVLAAGAKIRLGNTNGQTALANDTSNADTYTIQSITYIAGVGTSITLTSNLSTSYNAGLTNNTLYRGLVTQWNDKSNNAYNVTAVSIASAPLWISTAQNGLGGLRFEGADNMVSGAGAYPTNIDYTVGAAVNQTAVNTGNVLSGVGSGHAFYFSGTQRICMFSGSCFATSNTNLPYGTPGLISGTFVNATRVGMVYQNGVNVATGVAGSTNATNAFNLGSYGNGNYYTGFIDEAYLYNAALNTNQRALLDQYQSAKWNIALDPNSATVLSEAAEAMNSATGYSVFSSRYLERLAQTANISLLATNDITLDFQNDTLDLSTTGRSLTLTAGNQINTLSAGNITTNGGDITLNATGGINFGHAIGLTTNGGNINFNGTVDGAGSVTASGNTITLANDWGTNTPLSNISLTATSALTLPSITAGALLARTTGATADITVASGKTLTATNAGNALTVASGRNFINNSGAGTLSAASGRWLVYSGNPASNQRNGLMPSAAALYSTTYTGTPPASVAAGNRFLFSSTIASAPILTFTADNQTKQYGDINPTLTYTRTGSFVDADTALTAFSGTPLITTSIGTNSGAGTYTGDIDTAAGTLSTYLGYQLVLADGDFTITPAPLTITADNQTRLYGQSNPPFSATFLGLVAGDTPSSIAGLNLSTPATSQSVPGTYTITASGATSPNYTITQVNGTLTIGGSVPRDTEISEPIYRMILQLNAPKQTLEDPIDLTSLIEVDDHLANFLDCADREETEKKLYSTSCW